MDRDLNSEFLTISNRITEITAEIYDVNKQLDSLYKEKTLISSEITLKISSELDESGKKKYSNQQMRRAALVIQLSGNSKYLEIQAEIAKLRDVIHQFRLNLQKLNNERIYILLELGLSPPDHVL